MRKNTENREKINILALGNCSVGKTAYIIRYTENTFQQVYLATYGFDKKSKDITLENDKKYKLFFHDSAGEEKFKSISLNLMKNADGILLFYDITNKSSFDSISGWIKSIYDVKDKNFPIILLGNKCDLKNERIVNEEEGKQVANQYGFSFYEISNKDGINIEEPSRELLDKIIEYKKVNKNSNKDNINLNSSKKKASSCGC